jgi:hypothetical protein
MHGLAESHYGGDADPKDGKAVFPYHIFCMGALFYEIVGVKQPFDTFLHCRGGGVQGVLESAHGHDFWPNRPS